MSLNARLAFLMSTLGTGGVGKVAINLTRELVQRGIKVDMVLGKVASPYLSAVDSRVRVFKLRTSHAIFCLPGLIRYLRCARPTAVITDKLRVNIATLRSRRLAGVHTRVYAAVHGVVSHKLESEDLKLKKQRSKLTSIRRYYPLNDGFIAVSKGVAQDLIKVFKVPEDKIRVVYNPVVTPDIIFQSKATADHPWFNMTGTPIILGAGRLEPQKDFLTLIGALARLRQHVDCRLIILGEGQQRPQLESLAATLRIQEYVSFPGFLMNPYAFMAKADLFVLSSAWEGFGNVLVEALAIGLPVVSTDCPSGPREILQDGRYGPLVPVGDADALAKAMRKTLDKPLSANILKSAAEPYTAKASADGYLKALGFIEQ
jgi:glycosyltransferase involved in cell wall biosynthesis